MGPLILARALGDDVPYAVKVHGSDLTFTVGPYPRFRPHAAEGAERARGLLVGSRHTAEQLWGELDDPALVAKTRLGPPGVDVERFAPGPGDLAACGSAWRRRRRPRAPPSRATRGRPWRRWTRSRPATG